MTTRRRLGLVGSLGAGLALALAATPALATGSGLQPYQLVRSLGQVQDRIANGDHASLPMQRKLLEMVDKRLRAFGGDDYAEPRNFDALLIYSMSGGNPKTVEEILLRIPESDPRRKLIAGILYYISGNPQGAIKAFGPIDPMAYRPELGAYVALVKGSVLSTEQAEPALKLLDRARLLSPGTLVEEAALRRSVSLTTTLKDPKRFMRTSEQYVSSYVRSPYASQFADAFVAGVIALHADIKLDELAAIAGMMDRDQEKVIYLRIARRAAIDGLTELSAFASARANSKADEGEHDPRADLYSSLATVTSDNVEDVLKRLEGIDASRLTRKDRELLEAAAAVGAELTSRPQPAPAAPAAPAGEPAPDESHAAAPAAAPDAGPAEAAHAAAGEAPAADPEDHAAAPAAAGAHDTAPEAAHAPPAASPEAADSIVEAAHASSAASGKPRTLSGGKPDPAAEPDATDQMVARTRKTLEDIDKLLGDTDL